MLSILFVILATLFLFDRFGFLNQKVNNSFESVSKNNEDFRNMEYGLNGEVFKMVNGRAEKEIIPNTNVKNILYIYDNHVFGDYNNDGQEDVALWLINEVPGAGDFHYAVLNIKKDNNYIPTNFMFLGGNIIPKNIEVIDNRAVYSFVERGTSSSFEEKNGLPFMDKIVWVHFDESSNQIGEWVKDFEGEFR